MFCLWEVLTGKTTGVPSAWAAICVSFELVLETAAISGCIGLYLLINYLF